MGKGGDELMPMFLSGEEIAAKGAAIEERCKEVFEAKYRAALHAFPGTRELVQRLLADGRKVLLASSAGGEELEHYKRLARIDDLVADGASRDDVARSKPHPDIFEAALKKLNGLAREQVVVIGDSPFDAEAASKAGVRAIGVLSGGFTEAALRAAGCVCVYRDVADLLAQYDSSPLASR